MTRRSSASAQQHDTSLSSLARVQDGVYYTPLPASSKLMEEIIGPELGLNNVLRNYVVWDPACGTGNLTVGYGINNLFQSTINADEIRVMEREGVNFGSRKFVFDFTRYVAGTPEFDDALRELAPGLVEALYDADRSVLILMNPPYLNSTTVSTRKSVLGNEDSREMANQSFTRSPVALHMLENIPGGKRARNELASLFLYNVFLMMQKYRARV